ncbi:MAG: peptidoglycan DD-metalloendopeptidase family protein [Woeseia sp.]
MILAGLPALALAIPEHAPRPGGIAVLEIPASQNGTPPIVRFEGRRALVVRRDDNWLAIIGIPLDREPGPATASICNVGDNEPRTLTFDIGTHAYREQHLTVKPGYVNPAPEQLERIIAEREHIDAALARWSDRAVDAVTLRAPVDGTRSSSFGSRRFFNDEPRAPHRGMDIAAGAGTRISAPLDGTVLLAGDYYFTGNTVIVDHGQGLLTLYAHLQELAVEDGQILERGEHLGTVGATGRVTGPHLHFAVYLNGTPVDPALLLEAP